MANTNQAPGSTSPLFNLCSPEINVSTDEYHEYVDGCSASRYKKMQVVEALQKEKTNPFAKYFLSNSIDETDYCITIIPQSAECPLIVLSLL